MNELKPVANAWPVAQIERIKRDRRKSKDPKEKQQERTDDGEQRENEKTIDEFA